MRSKACLFLVSTFSLWTMFVIRISRVLSIPKFLGDDLNVLVDGLIVLDSSTTASVEIRRGLTRKIHFKVEDPYQRENDE